MLTARVPLPPVKPPSMRIAAPLPDVLDPNIESVGVPIALPPPDAAGGESSAPKAAPPRPVAVAPSPASAPRAAWVVQVGAFADDARATSLVAQLAGRGFKAFKSVRTMRNGAPLHVVLVGPFDARPTAAAALDTIEELPGVGQPIPAARPGRGRTSLRQAHRSGSDCPAQSSSNATKTSTPSRSTCKTTDS
jgi:DedD protein